MLVGHDLRKSYATVEAVAGVNLHVDAGEVLAICGRSGSGKSTLLAILAALCSPSAGTIRIEDVDPWSLPRDRLAEFRGQRVGFVYQFAGLLPTLRAVDNVALPALVAGRDLTAITARAAELLAEVGLAKRLSAYPTELSGGERRRVALARALINDPPLLLADEPTGDLDEQTEAEILRVLLAHSRQPGRAAIIVTHSAALAARADRVLYMQAGRIVDERTPTAAITLPPAVNLEPVSASVAESPTPPAPLGSGFGRFVVAFAVWFAGVGLTVLALNAGAALYQGRLVREQKSVRQELQDAALFQLRAAPADLAYEPTGACRLTLSLKNSEPEKDLFVLTPAVRAFVQVGRNWEEVPLRSADSLDGRVTKLTGEHKFRYDFEPAGKAFTPLLPGYMHVRFSCQTVVSRTSPGDPTERADDFYVYLKPFGADDEAILKTTKFPGRPPTWIAMPPH